MKTYSGLGIHSSSVPEQDADDVRLVGTSSQMQSCLSAHGGCVDVGPMLDQVDDDVHVAHEGGHVEWGQTGLRGCLNGSAVLQQELHHLDAVLLAGNVQRGEAIQSSGVHFALAIQE